jgi:hypothetical protein
MAEIKWDHSNFLKNVEKKGLDGLEEWAKVEWHPQAYRDAPKLTGTMAGSLGYERDNGKKCIYVGGGGQAKAYILKQELDRSRAHPTGKAGFISDNVQAKASKLSSYVKTHIEQ